MGDVEKEFNNAMELMSIADAYFEPLKSYSQQSRYFIQMLIEEGKTEDLFEQFEVEYYNMSFMWKFLAENRIAELGIEKIRSRWNEIASIDTSPEAVIKDDPDADFFVMNNTVYINAEDINWVKELSLSEGEILGEINESGVNSEFKNWDSTVIDVDIIIYECIERKDLVLVKTMDGFIPYLRWVEG